MKQANKNFIVGVVSESLWGMGFGLFMPATQVCNALVSLGGSATLAGLLASLFAAGLTLPQIFSALALPPRFTDPKGVVWLHTPAVFGPLIAGLGFLLFPQDQPQARLQVLLAGFTLFSVGIGVVIPYWAGLISRCLPERIRGRYFGACFFSSGLCASVTGWLGARWVSQGGTAWGYELCFLLAFPLMVLSILTMFFFKPLTGRPEAPSPGAIWKSFHLMGRKLLEPGAFRIGLVMVFLLVAATAPLNLFTVLLRKGGVGESWFEFFNPALSAGGMIGAFLLGWIVDHKGFRAAYAAAFAAGLVSMGLIFLHQTPLLPSLAYACMGFMNVAFPVVNLAYILKLGGKKGSTIQTGLFNTLMGPWNFVGPLFAGWLAEKAGYGWAFGLAAACCLAAFAVLLRSKELDGKGVIPARRAA